MDLQLGLFPDEPVGPPPTAVGPAPPDARARAVSEQLPRGLRLGTSSWSFPGWEGIVYDRPTTPSTLSREGLGAYAAHPLLRTVGLDRTYYRPMSAEDLGGLAAMVPEDFRFLVKADRLLTSPVDPEGFGVRGPNPVFLDASYATQEVVAPVVEGLGSKAGPLLFQFSPIPPNLVGGVEEFLDRLHRFLDALPNGVTYAIELRTPAFFNHAYASLLDETGAAHCFNVHPAMVSLGRQFELIQPYYQPTLVVRWMLHAGLKYEVAKERYQPFDRLLDEDVDSRDRIALAALDATIAERDVFVIANNKAEGSAPLSVFRLADRIVEWERTAARKDESVS